MSDKRLDINAAVPAENEVKPQYTSKDFDSDVDFERDDFDEGLELDDLDTIFAASLVVDF